MATASSAQAEVVNCQAYLINAGYAYTIKRAGACEEGRNGKQVGCYVTLTFDGVDGDTAHWACYWAQNGKG